MQSSFSFLCLFSWILQLQLPTWQFWMQLEGRKMNWPKSYKFCLTKLHTSPRAVQQLAILDAVLKTTARLTRVATVMWGATTSATAVTISHPLAATVSLLYNSLTTWLSPKFWHTVGCYFERWVGIRLLSDRQGLRNMKFVLNNN